MSKLHELPNDWEWVEWKFIVNVKNGKDYKSVLNKNGLYPIYGSGGIINYANEYLCNENTVIIGRKGTINSPIFVKEKFWNIDTAFGLEAKKDKLTPFFLYYFTLNFNFLTLNKSTTLPSLAKSNLQKILMPLPSISEQQRIVSKLDKLFEKIDKSISLHKKNIDEADVFIGSVLNEVFGELETNEMALLKSITTKIGSGSTPRGGQKSYKTEGISLIRSMNVHDTGFRKKGLAFIDNEQAKKLDNVTIQENDVLLNITGASVARCCIVDKNYLPARVNQHVSILRLKDEMLPKFLHYYLISPAIKTELLKSSSGGATREAITKAMLEEFQVPVVSLSQQEKIVTYLDKTSKKIEKIKSVQKDKMKSLVALKASILDQAFRGQL